MNPTLDKLLGGKQGAIGLAVLAVLILVVFPLLLDAFRLNMVGKYLTYAFVAVGLVLCWGYGGILSLGQGIFFGLGGYCMAMFLKLEASDPESTKIQSTPGIPDFMDWNQITELPMLWQPFHSFSFTLLAVVAVPVILALVIGLTMFKRRVGDVYFSIVTQAIALILTVLIIGQQGYTGGVNGITDLKTLMGWDIRTDEAKLILYFVSAFLLFGCILLARFIIASKLGRLLLAMRDKEERVRFSGYDVASFKIFVFCVGAAFAAIGGAMFTLQVGFMSPSFVGIVPSIEMVIFAAVGGRLSLLGAVYGALLVNFGKTYFSESFPELWLYLMGGLFIAVVMYFPNGLAGLWDSHGKRWLARLKPKTKAPVKTEPLAKPVTKAAPTPELETTPMSPNPAGFQMPKPVLAIEGLTVSFDGFKAVDDLNLYIDRNEVRVVIGPNGAGKTTVLDLICGKTKATAGSIQFENRELTKMREFDIVRAGVGRKFQNPSIYENLTVFENLEMSYPAGRKVFGALFFKRSQAVIERVEQVATEIMLGEHLHLQADLLSHGQKQWLEIGMLLMQDPQLLMLDEPVAGMSVSERVATADLLKRISQGRSVLVIEHDMEFVKSIAHKVTVLHQGKVLAEGSMDAVQSNPKVIEVYLGH